MEENQTTTGVNDTPDKIGGNTAATSSDKKKSTAGWSAVFGLFMIFIYFGMAYLTLFTNHFFWMVDWARYGLGAIFILYGAWRSYRYFKA